MIIDEKKDFIAEGTDFWSLIKKTRIEIPIIQRDYAQGRTGEEKVRQRFLDALYDGIANASSIELDFIYGSTESGALQPLDGQQRLTTLFLLHWYAAANAQLVDGIADMLKRFTYETRPSSRQFCEHLTATRPDFSKLLPADKGKQNALSKTIANESWFFLAWRKDPTIRAMLNMLDDIHDRFKDVASLWEKLSAPSSIGFQYIELRNFGLSDDLYIKMNARGKALTAFENFKAKLERHISRPGWDQKTAKVFATAVDTTWADLFWERIGDPEQIDQGFIKYFSGIIITLYAQRQQIQASEADRERMRSELQKRNTGKITNDAITRALVEERIEALANAPSELEPADLQHPSDLAYLIAGLDRYAELYKTQASIDLDGLSFFDQVTNGDLFHEFSRPKGQTTYKQRVLFYAQTAFLLSKEHNLIAFSHWLRVIRNIVEHATIDSAGTFIGAIGLVRELSQGIPDIYIYLADNKPRSNFADKPVQEERLKALILQQRGLPVDFFHAMEDTNFCKGRIMFGLYCMNLHENSIIDFIERTEGLTRVFKQYLSGNDVTNVFRRALLTIDDHRCYNYWWSWSYNTNTTKRCLIENMADLKEYAYKDWVRHYLSALLVQLIDRTPQEIIDGFEPRPTTQSWVTLLIKDEKLLDKHGQSKYFGLTEHEKQCYLYNNWKRPGSLKECYHVK